VQLEAIETALSFYLSRQLKTRQRVALVVEVRGRTPAETAFDGDPELLLRRPIPRELWSGLGGALRDESPAVQAQALYALGAMARPPVDATLETPISALLVHPDLRVSIAAMRVAARLRMRLIGESLVVKLNDPRPEVRFAAYDALGDLREARAVEALTNLVNYYGNDLEGRAAFEALARIGHPSSAPRFAPRLVDRDARVRQRAAEAMGLAGDRQHVGLLEAGVEVDGSEHVRLAMRYALHLLGRGSIEPLLLGLRSEKTAAQARLYFLALAPMVNGPLLDHLRSSSAPIRAAAAEMLGIIADSASLSALEPLAASEADPDARAAMTRAVERIRIAHP
jgi:HEAT repeat protein